MKRKYFQNLDGLRFILAMVVFFGHSRLGEVLKDVSSIDFFDRIINIGSAGYLAVSFFFTLSGFLITYLIIEEKENTGNFSLRNFYLRRIIRIWPLYYVVLFFTFFIYPLIKVQLGYMDQNPYNLLYQLFFLSNFDNISVDQQGLVDVAPMMISINWSIAIEEQFYAVWPILFFITGARRFWIAIISVILISWYCRTFLLEGHALYYHTFSVISDLGIGALLAYLIFYNSILVKRMENMSRTVIVMIYAGALFFFLYPEFLSSPYIPDRVFNAVFFAFIIFEQSFAKRSFYKFGKFSFLSSLGKYTYSFYLLHPIGIQVSIVSFRYLNISREDGVYYALLYVVAAFFATAFLSLASYRFIELFFLRVKDQFYSYDKNGYLLKQKSDG